MIREARKDVLEMLEILPAIQDNSEIMGIIKCDLEDVKGALVADGGEIQIYRVCLFHDTGLTAWSPLFLPSFHH